MSIIKGQYFRAFIGSKVVAMAQSCQLSVEADVQDLNSKDTEGDWKDCESVGLSWSGSADALVVVDSLDTSSEKAFDITQLIGTEITLSFQQIDPDETTDNNRTPLDNGVKYSGTAIVSDVNISAPNRANSTYTVQFQGTGALTKSTI